MAQNLYEILGLQKNASEDEIKRAYRKLAQKYHPDTSSGDKAGEQKFKEATTAYEVLSDKQKRSQYDQFGDNAFGQQNGGFNGQGANGFDMNGFGDNLADIFESFFGGQQGGNGRQGRSQSARGNDRALDITLTFEEAAFGTEKSFDMEKISRCERCDGSGALPGSKISTCSTCNGSGEVRVVKNTMLGQMTTRRVCDRCRGEGSIPEKPCDKCSGIGVVRREEKLKIKIPAGVDSGATLKITGKGDSAPRGGESGDLYVNIGVKAHKQFTRKGSDVYSEQSIDLLQAILGSNTDIQTAHGALNMKVPSGTQSGRLFKLKEYGIPRLGREGKGDHYVKLIVDIPQKISKKERELYMQLATEKGIDVSDEKGFLGKIFE